jgi:oligoribonuclease
MEAANAFSALAALSLEDEAAASRNGSAAPPPAAAAAEDGGAAADAPLRNPLVWIDCEMTGLDYTNDTILQIATIVTDGQLERVIEGEEIAIAATDAELDGMNPWCVEHHGASGLTAACRTSTVSMAEAEARVLAFVRRYVPDAGAAQLAGNTVHADLTFLRRQMPALAAHLHYRIVDVSTVGELARRWFPREHARAPRKRAAHTAMADIRESIAQLRYLRKAIFKSAPKGSSA